MGRQRIEFGEVAFEKLATALSATTCLALSIEPGTGKCLAGSKAPTPPDLICVCKMQDEAASSVQIARCFVSGQTLQKACADSRRSFPRLIRLAPQVVAGGALVEFSTVAVSR